MNDINKSSRWKRTAASGFAVLLCVLTATTPAAAADYPTRPVRVVVPISPGSATDVVVRVVAEKLATVLKQPVIVENRPGAGTTIAAGAVAREAADGYTLLANSTAHTVVPWTYARLSYNAEKDFVGVATLVTLPNVLVVSSAKGYHSVQELLQAARARPGALNYASAGSGTSTHLAAEKFRLATGIVATHVPYRGTPEALTATVAGEVDFFFAPATSVLPHIRSGALTALAISGTSAAPGLPHVRRLAEAGLSNADAEFWVGLFAPAGTPVDVVQRLNREINSALAAPEVVEKLAALGATPRPMSAAAFEALLRADFQANRELVRATGLRAD